MEQERNDWWRRGVRTFFQGFVGVLALIAVPQLNDLIQTVAAGGEVEIDVNFWGSIGVAAVGGGMVSLIAFGQNFLEDRAHVPAPLKHRPSSGQNPVPDHGEIA